MSQFGPSYEEKVDGERINTQMVRIRDVMIGAHKWHTLDEIRARLEKLYNCRFPVTSISAQLRHLKKREFGSYILEKRRRGNMGLYEYRLSVPRPLNATQNPLFEARA